MYIHPYIYILYACLCVHICTHRHTWNARGHDHHRPKEWNDECEQEGEARDERKKVNGCEKLLCEHVVNIV